MRGSRNHVGRDGYRKRPHTSLAFGVCFLLLACGLACAPRISPQESFDRDYQTFVHGDLIQSQNQAHRDWERFRVSHPEWAWKFKSLEAESLLWQGMYTPVLRLLDSQSTRPGNRDSIIELLAVEGVAHASLHEFSQAETDLSKAAQMCEASSELTCGDVIRARGILAVQHGQVESAKHYFEDSLQFARAHNDRFLEETALLNLGLTALRQGHYDEAIDWTAAAYQAATNLGASGEAQAAMGNLGWAYYNLGDSERSLELSLEAEKRALQVGEAIDQLYWTTNVGYVYAAMGDLALAKKSYLKALDLATDIKGEEGIYNALRALALVSVERNELSDARRYSDDAIKIARADNNRLDELYPLLVKGLVAARSGDGTGAERIFREVEQDQKGNASLKWRAEHGLARLYEDENRPNDADHEYRSALATFEQARSSLERDDSRLPFSNNASHIYDDYVHFLVVTNKPDDALRWADYSRARTLSEGFGPPSKSAPTSDRAGPPALNPREISRRAKGVLLFYWLGEKQSYLWAITPQKATLFPLPPGADVEAMVQRYRTALKGSQDVLESSEDGRSLYRTLIAPAKELLRKDAKVFIIPDGSLNNLNFETLIVADPKPHYWIEDADVANSSSLRVLAASFARHRVREKKHARNLLLIGDSVAPSKEYPELPRAGQQMANVAKHFPASEKRIYQGDQATPAAYLAGNPDQFAYVHFVAHGTSSRLSPLDSAIVLSKGAAQADSFKLYARDIVQRPLHADLVTISACYSAGERAYSGEGLVGLAWAFLRAGAHNVIAGLWEVTDASTEQLMDRFYDELDHGASPDQALRAAKLSLLRGSAFHNPFYWAPFQLYTGS
jgi:CHAT domain-containing protein/Flp pilus assembly protein TadD